MKANSLFLNQPKSFWANVRTISQHVGYTLRQNAQIKVPNINEMCSAMRDLGLDSSHIASEPGIPTEFGELLSAYYEYRAEALNNHVQHNLMNVSRAREVFTELKESLTPSCPIPMNKQKGEKKAEAYFTGIINMIIEAHAEGLPCDYDPRELTAITYNNTPLRTLARRVDGAFPSTINPIAIWEIKEYYYTTTFGSRVADGVYESLLDGMELEELREHEDIDVKHYLMVDDSNTWWRMGRSYLCRIIDMLHMGYIDEALFGYEVVEELPKIVQEWVQIARMRGC
ncbi:hypothetical protein [Leptolyngbya sp. FACHB-711]|uniref:DUF7687 domain-containing protein n=1 Tax=Leptolyngbya sp. FACHB-711 TaxID=2692813 RepID=UPI0018EF3F6A|nr:hypothetical protein [Leptolyngbya sp. FACHB-711]